MATPLEGIRILDLSRIWAGPYATKLLADMGAEVIKIEAIQSYDTHRGPRPAARGVTAYPDREPGSRPWNRNGWFNSLNMNKLGLTVDLTQSLGRKVFDNLVMVSDVVVENFRYGVMERLGYSYQVLARHRPDIIFLSMPAFGNSGPWRTYVQYGVGQEQLAGMSYLTGYTGEGPMKSGINHGDPITGSHAAGAILAALLYRRRTGRGLYIDLSHLESAVSLMGEQLLGLQLTGSTPERRGNGHSAMAPHGVYPCRGEDRWVSIAVASDKEWRRLCGAMGRPDLRDDPHFSDALSRYRNQDRLDGEIAPWTQPQDFREVALLLQRAGVAAEPVLSAKDLLEDPHFKERGAFEEVTHMDAGTHLYAGIPWKLSRTPGAIRRAAPLLGEHNQHILQQLLGMGQRQIDELQQQSVIGTEPAATT